MTQNVALRDPATGLEYRAGGTQDSPDFVTAENTQARQASTVALPAFYILAKDVNDADALIGVMSVAKGAANIATLQIPAPITTSGQIVAARIGRGAVTITNITGAQQVYVGPSGVTVATGQLIPATVGASITIPTSAAIFAISVTAAQTVSVLETF